MSGAKSAVKTQCVTLGKINIQPVAGKLSAPKNKIGLLPNDLTNS